jgi:hypothetical protein
VPGAALGGREEVVANRSDGAKAGAVYFVVCVAYKIPIEN